MEDDSIFDYQIFRELVSELELLAFFDNNEFIPRVVYPLLDSHKREYTAMIDWLYKRALEESEAKDSPPEKLDRDHLNPDETEKHDPRFNKSLEMFWNSQFIASIFRNFFTLVDFHPTVVLTRLDLRETYLKTIFKVCDSLIRDDFIRMLSMICTSPRMYEFYYTLYVEWMKETDKKEREILLCGLF